MDHRQQVQGRERIAEVTPQASLQAVDTSGSAFDLTRQSAIRDLRHDILFYLQPVSIPTFLWPHTQYVVEPSRLQMARYPSLCSRHGNACAFHV